MTYWNGAVGTALQHFENWKASNEVVFQHASSDINMTQMSMEYVHLCSYVLVPK